MPKSARVISLGVAVVSEAVGVELTGSAKELSLCANAPLRHNETSGDLPPAAFTT